jgi:hypothetical protein
VLRGVVAIVGLLVGMAVTALPAAAHATHSHAPTPRADRSASAEPAEAHGTPAVEAAHDHQAEIHDHETAPLHSHAPGEDTYHQKASHCTLDVANMPKTISAPRSAIASVQIAITEDSLSGITVSPPVPPPLG